MHLSYTRQKILEYISMYTKERGYPPTIREIAAARDIKAISAVHYHLGVLEDMGLIKRDPRTPRALTVVDNELDEDKVLATYSVVPLLGSFGDYSLPDLSDISSVGKMLYPIYIKKDMLPDDRDCFAMTLSGKSDKLSPVVGSDDILICRKGVISNGKVGVWQGEYSEVIVGRLLEDEIFPIHPYCWRGGKISDKLFGVGEVLLVLRTI